MSFNKDSDSVQVRYTEHFGPLGSQFAINFFFSHVEIKVNRLIAKSRHVLYVNLVEPLLRFIFISKGYILLHSACIANDQSEGILFSAPPDTGKTTTVLKSQKKGYWLLSDDMTILKFPNTALCFPKPMTISAHTYKTATNVSDNIDNNKKEKSNLKFRSLIHSKKGRQFMRKLGKINVPIFTINTIGQSIVKPPKFNVQDLLQEVRVKDNALIKSLYFLELGDKSERISKFDALQKALENSDDAFIFPPYNELIKHIHIGGKTSTELFNIEKSMINEFFSNIDVKVLKSNTREWLKLIENMTLGIIPVFLSLFNLIYVI